MFVILLGFILWKAKQNQKECGELRSMPKTRILVLLLLPLLLVGCTQISNNDGSLVVGEVSIPGKRQDHQQ